MAWEWDNSEKQLFTPVVICRQPELFDTTSLKNNEFRVDGNFIAWEWPGDTPILTIPKTALDQLPDILPSSDSALRDIIAYFSTLYRLQRYPEDNEIYTSFREIADSVGIAWWRTRRYEIEDMLLFAKMIAVKKYLFKTIDPRTKQITTEEVTFGFVNDYGWIKDDLGNNETIPTHATLRVALNKYFTRLIRETPIAPVPVEALFEAQKAPNRIIPIAKNIVYRLAARVPPKKPVEYLFDAKFKQQVGISPNRRNDKARETFERAVKYIEPIMLYNFDYIKNENKYVFELKGKKMLAQK